MRALRAEHLKRGCSFWLDEDGHVEMITEGAEQGVMCRIRPHSAVMLDWAVWFRLIAVEPGITVPPLLAAVEKEKFPLRFSTD